MSQQSTSNTSDMLPRSVTIYKGYGVVYEAVGHNDLAKFLTHIHTPSLFPVALDVKYISVQFPHDDLFKSDLLQLLEYSRPDPPREILLPGDLGVAADMLRALSEQHNGQLQLIPISAYFQLLVQLFCCCRHLQTLDLPPYFLDATLYPGNFPAIEVNGIVISKRMLPDGRWRFGRDPPPRVEKAMADMRDAERKKREEWEKATEEQRMVRERNMRQFMMRGQMAHMAQRKRVLQKSGEGLEEQG